MQRAELESEDPDAAFIFYWIAFNAVYAADMHILQATEKDRFEDFLQQINGLDDKRLVYNTLWNKFSGPIRLILDNKYVFQPFWDYHNRAPGYDEHWEMRFHNSVNNIHDALAKGQAPFILNTLFERLYVLRNQLVHGGATWNSSVNRYQVKDGARIMASLVPIFIGVMMEHPEFDWGPPYYPVVP